MAEFVEVAKTEDLKSGEAKVIKVKGKQYALYNVDGKFYATQNECPHKKGPLGEGSFDGKVIICPWHGAMFDVTTGKVLEGPAETDIRTYEVKVKDGKIFLKA